MIKQLCAKTMHQIALLAQERANEHKAELSDAASIYERIRVQGMVDALDDFAESLWLRAGEL